MGVEPKAIKKAEIFAIYLSKIFKGEKQATTTLDIFTKSFVKEMRAIIKNLNLKKAPIS